MHKNYETHQINSVTESKKRGSKTSNPSSHRCPKKERHDTTGYQIPANERNEMWKQTLKN